MRYDEKQIEKTMTVGKFRQYLLQYPDDLPMIATWEGVYAIIIPENIAMVHTSVDEWDLRDALVIDVEDNF